MSLNQGQSVPVTYYVDEAGDGVLFGRMGRDHLRDPGASRYFMLGMVRCARDAEAAQALADLRRELTVHPLYASIPSMQPEERKTARAFHAKDDHPEIRAKVFERLLEVDFRFYALVKDMRSFLAYVRRRNLSDSGYRYHPNEMYDLTVRMLFRDHLHLNSEYRVTFARRGNSDRTEALRAARTHTPQLSE